ncbi:MAG: carboxypeptidase-like regulatory domain-containing protein [Bacteroidota bacterium]
MKKIFNSKFKLPAFVPCLLISTASLAQSISVSGKITGDEGDAVPGVTVVEKGTTHGTVTDQDGQYSIQVVSGSATLIFSFVGYKTAEILVDNRTVIDVSLTSDITSLQEVVVTGYASQRKADVVAAISQVSPTSTVAIPQGDVSQALQGRVAGVQVTTSGATRGCFASADTWFWFVNKQRPALCY